MTGNLPEQIAQEIMDYLSAHPKACDTPAGIATWWIHHQRILRGLEMVEQALEWLESEGLVKRAVGGDGRVIYSLNRDAERKA